MATFEIKVALLGHVSAGKTTVLNALFKDKYSEVSMRRTTAGINYFRVKSYYESRHGPVCQGRELPKGPYDAVTRRAASILKEITALNVSLRSDPKIDEKYFEVQLEEPLFNMRSDTELVIVDVPGLNEAGTSSMYHTYVSDNWETFDCVILVTDVREGVNTEAQIALLNFVKSMREKRATPLIVLCNKVDEPDDPEIKTLVAEVKQEVSRIFAKRQSNLSFIPISACNAFIYRAASRLPLKDFKRLDKEHINRIGKEECGRYKWQEMSEEEQYSVVYDVVNHKSRYDARLKTCNFDAFMRSLENVVGTDELQAGIILRQLQLAQSKVSFSGNFVEDLYRIFDKSNVFGKYIDDNDKQFWKLWEKAEADAFAKFSAAPAVSHVHRLFDLLEDYASGLHSRLHELKSAEQTSRIVDAMKDLVRKKCLIILAECSKWVPNAFQLVSCYHRGDYWSNRQTGEIFSKIPTYPDSWSVLTIFDWSAIVDSICIHSQNKVFSENFSPQYAALLGMLRFIFVKNGATSPLPTDPRRLSVKVPVSLSDPTHWGYLEWKVCQFIEKSGTSGAASGA